jgi:two-component system sensor histidine kinase GlrK
MARLYQVLGDMEHLADLNAVHYEIEEVVEHLHQMGLDEDLVQQVSAFEQLEQKLVDALNDMAGQSAQAVVSSSALELLLQEYQKLRVIAKAIEQIGNEVMIAEVNSLQQSVSKGKETLIFQTSGLILFAVILIILFVVLISKPVRQIDRAIDRLGEGDFTTTIEVSGPKDLETLGRKLDWLRRRLSQLDREKVKMIAHISHELKTPLASIKEGAGLLRDELVGPTNEKQKNVVRILDKNSSKLQDLIQNILDFNMAQAGKQPDSTEELAMEELLAKVVSDHQNSMIAKRIDLKKTIEPVKVVGNRQQITTVFDNLISNAIKYTPVNGVITITMQVREQNVRCVVADNGPGVEQGDRARIFSPFFQGKKPKNITVKGSGLGLAISKEYVQNHGGSLRLMPIHDGAHFEVILPLT